MSRTVAIYIVCSAGLLVGLALITAGLSLLVGGLQQKATSQLRFPPSLVTSKRRVRQSSFWYWAPYSLALLAGGLLSCRHALKQSRSPNP